MLNHKSIDVTHRARPEIRDLPPLPTPSPPPPLRLICISDRFARAWRIKDYDAEKNRPLPLAFRGFVSFRADVTVGVVSDARERASRREREKVNLIYYRAEDIVAITVQGFASRVLVVSSRVPVYERAKFSGQPIRPRRDTCCDGIIRRCYGNAVMGRKSCARVKCSAITPGDNGSYSARSVPISVSVQSV